MPNQPSEKRHPLSALILLIALVFAGCFVFIVLAQIFGNLVWGVNLLAELSTGRASVNVQRVFLACYSVGAFVIPPLVYARLQSRKPFDYLKLQFPKPLWFFLITILIMLVITPFLEWSVYINQQMKLPAFMEPIETWMKYKEMEAEILTKNLLVMHSTQSLLLNLLIIAVIPAVGEELIFRGCIQRILSKATHNYHIGIWGAAIIFSAIHLQFYGFLPRMLLGALFGYIFVFSKSLVVPMLAHFYNNGMAVISAFVLQQQGKSLDTITKPESQKWYLVILSVIFTALLIRMMFKTYLNNQGQLVDER
jgi:membrane protease YdiL (CAAX protease family)